MRVTPTVVGLLSLALASISTARSESLGKVREDLEQELRKIVPFPDPELSIDFVPMSSEGYLLKEAVFILDDKELDDVGTEQLQIATGPVNLFKGTVREGRHNLVVKLSYSTDFGLVNYLNGYKFNLAQKARIETRRGLLAQLRVRPFSDAKQDWEHRLGISIERQNEMIAKLDDGDLPALARKIQQPSVAEAVAKADEKENNEAQLEKKEPEAAPAKVAVVKTKRPLRNRLKQAQGQKEVAKAESAASIRRESREPKASRTWGKRARQEEQQEPVAEKNNPKITLAEALMPTPEPAPLAAAAVPEPVAAPAPVAAPVAPVRNVPAAPVSATVAPETPSLSIALVAGAGVLGLSLIAWAAVRRKRATKSN